MVNNVVLGTSPYNSVALVNGKNAPILEPDSSPVGLLHDELLQTIFLNLSVSDLFLRVPLTCRKWHRVQTNEFFLKTIIQRYIPDSVSLIYLNADHRMYLQDVEPKKEEIELPFNQKILRRLSDYPTITCLTTTATKLYSGSNDGIIRMWDLSDFSKCEKKMPLKGRIEKIQYDNDKLYIQNNKSHPQSSQTWNGCIGEPELKIAHDNLCLINVLEEEKIKVLSLGQVNISSFHVTGNRLFSSTYDGSINIWDTVKQNVETFQVKSERLSQIHVTNSKICALADNKTLKIFDIESTKEVFSIKSDHKIYNYQVKNNQLFANTKEGDLAKPIIKVWDLTTGDVIANFNYEYRVLGFELIDHKLFTTRDSLIYDSDWDYYSSGSEIQILDLRMQRIFRKIEDDLRITSFHVGQGIIFSGHSGNLIRYRDFN